MARKVKEVKRKFNGEQWYDMLEKKATIYKASKIAFNAVCFVIAGVFTLASFISKNNIFMIVGFLIMFGHSVVKCLDYLFDKRMYGDLTYLLLAIYGAVTSFCCVLSLSGILPFAKFFILAYLIFGYFIFIFGGSKLNFLKVDFHDWSKAEAVTPICDVMIVVFLTLVALPLFESFLARDYSYKDEEQYQNGKIAKQQELSNSKEYKFEEKKKSLKRRYIKRETYNVKVDYDPKSIKWVSERYIEEDDEKEKVDLNS